MRVPPLRPPNVGEVRNALRVENPAACKRVVPSSRSASTRGRDGRVLHRYGLAVALDELSRTSLPRRAVSSSLPGVSRSGSMAAALAYACRSARVAPISPLGPRRVGQRRWTTGRRAPPARRPGHRPSRRSPTRRRPRRLLAGAGAPLESPGEQGQRQQHDQRETQQRRSRPPTEPHLGGRSSLPTPTQPARSSSRRTRG